MAKIHTHYDNLKVARLAPPEVIRAAYKALSQKYHPDKNAGDEKAARIMAIVNSAYAILSDTERRKEHDEWIAAEEWEIAWLESTRADEERDKARPEVPMQSWEPKPVTALPYRAARDPAWWFGIGAAMAIGLAAGILLMGEPNLMPQALASALGAKPARIEAPQPVAEPVPVPPPALAAPAASDEWAVGPRGASSVKSLAITQLVVPPRVPNCDARLQTLVAPNGEPWPESSGYVAGYPVSNEGEQTELKIDNSDNSSPVFVKIYDLDRRSNVRHLYVLGNDSVTVDKLRAGKYEVRYQNVEVGGSAEQCPDAAPAVSEHRDDDAAGQVMTPQVAAIAY